MSCRFIDPAARPEGRPIVLGHRGAPRTAPENTLGAFRRAMEEGADGVELDAMRCGSGEVVVVHDDDLRRVTGDAPGSERPVRAMTLAELRRFDLGGGECVPTLAEVLELLGPEALVNVELKSQEAKGLRAHLGLLRDEGLAAAVAEVLRRAGRLGRAGTTLVSSFDPLQLLRFRRCAGGAVPLGYLFHRELSYPLRQAWPAALLRPAALHPDAGSIDGVAMRRWRRAGYAVHAWTVDDPTELRALVSLGVDGIITNTPARTLRLLEEMATSWGPSPGPCTRRAASSPPG